jgi:ERCC4-type nuclease
MKNIKILIISTLKNVVMSIYHLTYLVNRKNGSKNLLPDLMKNGINCDLRVLQVGDLLWIAREKTACMQSNVEQNILLNVQDFFNFMILHLRISST